MFSIIYGKHYKATTTLNQFANFVFAIRNVMLLNPSIRGSVHFTFTVNIFMGVIICAKVQIKQQGRCHTVHPSTQQPARCRTRGHRHMELCAVELETKVREVFTVAGEGPY